MRTTYGPKRPVSFWTKRLMNIKHAAQEVTRFRLMSTSLVQAEQVPANDGHVSQRMLVVWFKHGMRAEFQPDTIREDPITLTDAYRAEAIWRAVLKRQHPLGEVYVSHPAAIAKNDGRPEGRMKRLINLGWRRSSSNSLPKYSDFSKSYRKASDCLWQRGKCSKVFRRGGDVMTPLFNGHALRNCRAYFQGNCRNCGRWDHKPSPKQSGLELMPCRLRMTILLLNLAALTYQRIPCSSFSFGNRPFSVFHFLLDALALFHSLVLFISMLQKAANECFPPGVFKTSSTRAKAFEHRHGVLRYVAAK